MPSRASPALFLVGKPAFIAGRLSATSCVSRLTVHAIKYASLLFQLALTRLVVDPVDVASVSALSALGGSVVGGLTTGFTTWMSGRSQARAGHLVADVARRQDLFREFIVAASKTYAKALVSAEPNIPEAVALWAMVSRMRVLCSPHTTASAERVMHQAMDTFSAPPKTAVELHELIKRGVEIDPLKEFSETAREELRTLSL